MDNMYSIELMELVNKERIRPLSKYEYRKRLRSLKKEKPDLYYTHTPDKAYGVHFNIVNDKYIDRVISRMLEDNFI